MNGPASVWSFSTGPESRMVVGGGCVSCQGSAARTPPYQRPATITSSSKVVIPRAMSSKPLSRMVCMPESTKDPVVAALTAISAVSRSRT